MPIVIPQLSSDWVTVENALRAWVKSATGFADAQVIWDDQTGGRPAGPFASLHLGPIVPVGFLDELANLRAVVPVNNVDTEFVAQCPIGLREFSCAVSIFGGDVLGNAASRSIASLVQLALRLESTRGAFVNAGFSNTGIGEVESIDALLGTKFEARARVVAKFLKVESSMELVPFIDTIEAVSYLGPPGLGTRNAIDF